MPDFNFKSCKNISFEISPTDQILKKPITKFYKY